MKKVIIFSMLIFAVLLAESQQTNPGAPSTKQDYLQKSKKQKKIAWILLGSGAVLDLVGVAIPKGDVTGTSSNPLVYGTKEYENDGIKAAFFIVGNLAVLSSIPVFIASGKNKRRAMSLSFKNERVPEMQKKSFVYKAVPSLNIKISL